MVSKNGLTTTDIYMDLPIIGLGTWEVTNTNKINNIIKTAFANHYTHIDTAQIYGNETQIGNALARIKNHPRSSYFLTTKIWPTNYKYHTTTSLDQSLKRLRTSYVDLVLLHTNSYRKNNIIAYRALMKARENKKIHFIGVSNFSISDIRWLYKKVHEYPYANQIIASPLHRMKKLEKFCNQHNIKLIGYSTIRPYYNPNVMYGAKAGLTDTQRFIIRRIAHKHTASPAIVMLRWAIQHNYSIIPKSICTNRIVENYRALSIKLSPKEMNVIDKMHNFSDAEFSTIMQTWEKRTHMPEKKLRKGFLYKKYSYRLVFYRFLLRITKTLKIYF